MKTLYAIFSAVIIAIGCLHMATTFRLSGTSVSKIWFFGAGIALVLDGILNLLNRQYGRYALGVRVACIATNLFMFCFAGVAGRVTNAGVAEQVVMLFALAATLVLSTLRSASINGQALRTGD